MPTLDSPTPRHKIPRTWDEKCINAPVYKHFQACNQKLTPDHEEFLSQCLTSKLEAIYIKRKYIFRTTKKNEVDALFVMANQIHPNLQFTIEQEADNSIAFLGMWVSRSNNRLEATDTGGARLRSKEKQKDH